MQHTGNAYSSSAGSSFDTRNSTALSGTDDNPTEMMGHASASDARNPLRRAMASVDLRMALENLGQNGDPDDSFERSLEAELGNCANPQAGSSPDDDDADLAFEAATEELEKTCREIAREAQINLRIDQIVRERNRELRSSQAETEPPLSARLARAISNRKLTLAAMALFMLGVTSYLAAVPISGSADRSDRHVSAVPLVVDTPVRAASAAYAGSAAPRKDDSRLTADGTQAEDWKASLGYRLAAPAADAPTLPNRTLVPHRLVAISQEKPASAAEKKIEELVREPSREEAVSVASLTPDPPVEPASRPVPDRVDSPKPETASLKPRSPVLVESALSSARGLESLRSDQRQLLAERLSAGECLSTALGTVFSKVPVLAMRDLVLQLDGEC